MIAAHIPKLVNIQVFHNVLRAGMFLVEPLASYRTQLTSVSRILNELHTYQHIPHIFSWRMLQLECSLIRNIHMESAVYMTHILSCWCKHSHCY